MRIYDIGQAKFITIDNSNITSRHVVGDLTVVLDCEPIDIGSVHKLSNFVDMIPIKGFGVGLSKVPSCYYTNDSTVDAYFSNVSLVQYNLNDIRVYFNFDVEIIKKIDKLPHFMDMTGDSCELIIYKK